MRFIRSDNNTNDEYLKNHIHYNTFKNNTHHHNNNGDNDTIHFILANGFIVLFLSFCVICILTQIRKSRGDPYIAPTENEIYESETCPICLEDLNDIEDSVRIRVCTHVLCRTCAYRLLDNNIHTCPVCRRHFYLTERENQIRNQNENN